MINLAADNGTMDDLFLCLEPFHWTCVLFRCQGKLLRGSAPDDALIECAVFAPGVTECLERQLSGPASHKDVECGGPDPFTLVADVLALQGQNCISIAGASGDALRITVIASQHCSEQFEVISGQMEKLHQDFRGIEKGCGAKFELC